MNAPRLVARVRKTYPGFTLDAELSVSAEVHLLFGPSGSGKTTLLHCLAGLVAPDAGTIRLEGETFFQREQRAPDRGWLSSRLNGGRSISVPARARRVGLVSQDNDLFPHLTAASNVAFPLRGADRGRRARALLDRVGIAHLSDRYPSEMSGGQRQRVAIARAMAREPAMLLLDEPVNALDAGIREALLADLRALQRDLDLVVILVTHRLDDALAVGDRITVLTGGRVRSTGPVEDMLRRPTDPGVAQVMGIRNLLRAKVVSTDAELALDWDGIRLLAAPSPHAVPGARVTVYIRPDDVKLLYPDRPRTEPVRDNVIEGRIVTVDAELGGRRLNVLLPNGHVVEVRFPATSHGSLRLEPGAPVTVCLRRAALKLLDAATHADSAIETPNRVRP